MDAAHYTLETAEYICAMVAVSPHGLSTICARDDHIPSPTTINYWRNTHPEFDEMYEHAKIRQAEMLAEHILELSDESRGLPDEFNAIKLQIETRKWLAGKLKPRRYGDRSTVETIDTTKEDEMKADLLERQINNDKKYKKDY